MALRVPGRINEFQEILEEELRGKPYMVNRLIDDFLVAGVEGKSVDLLRTVATHSPDGPEGNYAESGSSKAGKISGGFHRARVCIASVEESDPLTRLKLKIGILFFLNDYERK